MSSSSNQSPKTTCIRWPSRARWVADRSRPTPPIRVGRPRCRRDASSPGKCRTNPPRTTGTWCGVRPGSRKREEEPPKKAIQFNSRANDTVSNWNGWKSLALRLKKPKPYSCSKCVESRRDAVRHHRFGATRRETGSCHHYPSRKASRSSPNRREIRDPAPSAKKNETKEIKLGFIHGLWNWKWRHQCRTNISNRGSKILCLCIWKYTNLRARICFAFAFWWS